MRRPDVDGVVFDVKFFAVFACRIRSYTTPAEVIDISIGKALYIMEIKPIAVPANRSKDGKVENIDCR